MLVESLQKFTKTVYDQTSFFCVFFLSISAEGLDTEKATKEI